MKMAASTLANNSIQLKTKGPQPITLTPIVMPRKDSQEIASRTLQKRTNQTKSIVKMIAGRSDDVFSVQTANLVKSVNQKAREEIIKKLNIKTMIPAEHLAAMKASQNIPWTLLREIRSWLATFNLRLSAEGNVRKVAEESVGEGLKSEYAPLTQKNGKKCEVVSTPWCYIYHLVGHVLARLNNLKESDALVNHPFIPKDEIHVKIGGDHGGGFVQNVLPNG